ncbi:MAG TPA: FtsX-like permease family protein, partial [Xanthomonadales bacterium]|nr:FtsX-like permease family protein [Xanthomonadales bacterium]
ALREVAPDSPVSDVRTMDEVLGQTTQSRRFFAGLMAAFGGVALLLAAIGLYGVIAYGVAQRRREFGVRMSLGAASRDLLALVLRQGAVLVGAGVALGLVGAFALTRLIAAQLFGVAPHDPVVLASVCGVLLFVALAACWLPARRAAATSPVEALRYE